MSRLLTSLTLVPTVFTFIAIILINVGGFNSYNQVRSAAFPLISWRYTVHPSTSPEIYSYYNTTLYLSRICYSRTSRQAFAPGYNTNQQCLNTGSARTLRDTELLKVGNTRLFDFDAVYLNAPFAMYILAALAAVGAMLVVPVSLCTGRNEREGRARGVKLVGMILSLVTFVFMLIGSAVITCQIVKLRGQILHGTPESLPTSSYGVTTTYLIQVNSLKIGTTVLGLTWGAVVAMLTASALWILSWMREEKLARQEEGGRFEMMEER